MDRLKYFGTCAPLSFDAVVSPTVVFGLATVSLSRLSDRLAMLQRRMIRSIVDWVQLPEEAWKEKMRRMKDKVSESESADASSILAKNATASQVQASGFSFSKCWQYSSASSPCVFVCVV